MNRRIISMLAGEVIAASPALAADLPHRKPALWEVKYRSPKPEQSRHNDPALHRRGGR